MKNQINDPVYTALFAAIEKKRTDLLEKLLDEHKGLDLNRRFTLYESTHHALNQAGPLHFAMHTAPNRQLPLLLVRHHADPNLSDGSGQRPLHVIYHNSSAAAPDIASALLENGADPNARDHEGRTPLFAALLWYRLKNTLAIVDVLLAHGADRAAQDKGGRTLLELARSDFEKYGRRLVRPAFLKFMMQLRERGCAVPAGYDDWFKTVKL